MLAFLLVLAAPPTNANDVLAPFRKGSPMPVLSRGETKRRIAVIRRDRFAPTSPIGRLALFTYTSALHPPTTRGGWLRWEADAHRLGSPPGDPVGEATPAALAYVVRATHAPGALAGLLVLPVDGAMGEGRADTVGELIKGMPGFWTLARRVLAQESGARRKGAIDELGEGLAALPRSPKAVAVKAMRSRIGAAECNAILAAAARMEAPSSAKPPRP